LGRSSIRNRDASLHLGAVASQVKRNDVGVFAVNGGEIIERNIISPSVSELVQESDVEASLIGSNHSWARIGKTLQIIFVKNRSSVKAAEKQKGLQNSCKNCKPLHGTVFTQRARNLLGFVNCKHARGRSQI
jgi:hypothetical protein